MKGLLVSTGVVALAEMGDKTQLATVALAAHYHTPLLVIARTTLGMLIDVPAVVIGDRLAEKLPMKLLRSVAAAIFALLGILSLLGVGSRHSF